MKSLDALATSQLFRSALYDFTQSEEQQQTTTLARAAALTRACGALSSSQRDLANELCRRLLCRGHLERLRTVLVILDPPDRRRRLSSIRLPSTPGQPLCGNTLAVCAST